MATSGTGLARRAIGLRDVQRKRRGEFSFLLHALIPVVGIPARLTALGTPAAEPPVTGGGTP
jgi:hypothetical protein